jgi:hypothetical protein
MATNTKQTSSKIASQASSTLQNAGASKTAKSLAASALSQRVSGRQTGAHMEDVASRALSSNKSAEQTKDLAASVLSQSNKAR